VDRWKFFNNTAINTFNIKKELNTIKVMKNVAAIRGLPQSSPYSMRWINDVQGKYYWTGGGNRMIPMYNMVVVLDNHA
jgi:hypothetical protein